MLLPGPLSCAAVDCLAALAEFPAANLPAGRLGLSAIALTFETLARWGRPRGRPRGSPGSGRPRGQQRCRRWPWRSWSTSSARGSGVTGVGEKSQMADFACAARTGLAGRHRQAWLARRGEGESRDAKSCQKSSPFFGEKSEDVLIPLLKSPYPYLMCSYIFGEIRSHFCSLENGKVVSERKR